MPEITYTAVDGSSVTIEAGPGDTIMSAAVRNGVPGIIGDCGGNASCATCHVFVDRSFLDRLPPTGDMEEDLLDLAVTERHDNSRLGCQIPLTAELDGIGVETPETQP